MGQQEVLNYLIKYPKKYFSIVDLCKVIKMSRNSISEACKKLRNHEEIEFILIRYPPKNRYLYKLKRTKN